MKSVMSHNFSRVPRAEIQRSSFNRSHGHKTTFDAGYLVPFFVDEVLPGDTFNCRATLFARLATPIVPFMDNLFMDTFFFFVPCRLLWENWERFNGAQDNPGDSTDYLIPTLADNTTFDVGTLGDYFGIPTGVSLSNINSMPFRAYNLIWNEWFRDENLQDSVDVPKDDGTDDVMDYQLLRRGKRHDYFTSCLPWPQKGPGVELPVGGLADVKFADDYDVNAPIPLTFNINQQPYPATYWDTDQQGHGIVPRLDSSQIGGLGNFEGASVNIYNPLASLPAGGLVADLSTATAVTINSFRMAFQVQRLYERDARGGTRYTEMLTAHFGVVSPDARLQRPEYLGGSSSPVVINPVQQTSSTDNTTPQGNLAAYGLVGSRVHGFTKSFVEHGYLIGLVNVRADLTYQQGLNRMWSRQTRFDFYWPALAHLGEQAVLNKEIYADGTAADDDVFGYQERFAEYRYFPSKITGKFRSTFAQPLDAWHLSQKFETRPVLNAEFIVDEPPIDRVVAVPSEPHFLFDSYIQLNCVRPMPVYSVPGLIDHF
ncbi:capsid protein (F protein) [Phascolarctobacterium faecium DSM 14760]|nr:major capsid protein [Phascolarctobacterium faecium]RAS55770.1 capsid protein (F protein) [Phascolarctobacterium faecium DSM 14760]